jgi:uncharacterized RDD family membrane protein YckC
MTIPPVPPQPGSYPPPPEGYPPPGGYPPPQGGYPPPPQGGYLPPQTAWALPKQAYTPWLTRVAAYFIDAVPVALLVGIGQAIAVATAENTCITDSTDSSLSVACTSQPTGLGVAASLIFALLGLAFAVWNYGYRQGTTGSSIGKTVMKFKVVGEVTGQPIGFGRSVLRQLAHFLDTVFCYVGYLFPLWDAKRQTIADKVMSTVCLPT